MPSPGLLPALLLSVVAGSLWASDPPPKKKVADVPGAAVVQFADGSSVRMILAQPEIDITTRYGKLSVPIEDIRRIEFGVRIPADKQEQIDSLIDKLHSSAARVRDGAAADLLAFGALAYPALKRMAANTEADVAHRARQVIAKLEDKLGVDSARLRDQDTINAASFTVSGRINSPILKGQTSYFGAVSVQVAELRTIRFLHAGGGAVELVVDAAKFAALSQDVWLDTEVDFVEGSGLEISAAGQVDLYPSGGNYKVGPDAMPRQGNAPDGNPAGILLGRIGEKGRAFQVGAKFVGTPADSGRLYLRIACSPWNNASTGNYIVKIDGNADVDSAGGPRPEPKTAKTKSKKK